MNLLFFLLAEWVQCHDGTLINQIPSADGTKTVCDCAGILCPTPAPVITPTPCPDLNQWVSEAIRLQHELSNCKDAVKRRDTKIKQCKKW